MITQTGVENLWTHGGVRDRYAKHPRARPWGLTRDSQRQFCWLWEAVRKLVEPIEADKLFTEALEQLADAGVNCLAPKPPAELQPPANWKDLWGRDLKNPFDKTSPDLQGQTLIMQRDPELATWLKKFAESPYSAACEWQDAQSQVLKKKALVYDADTHAVNPYVNGANQTELAKFVRNAPPEVNARAQWEAKEIEFPVGRNSNLTIQSKIAKNPRLSALWNSMQEAERTHIASAKAALQQQQSEAVARLKALEAASDDAPQPPRMSQRSRVGAE